MPSWHFPQAPEFLCGAVAVKVGVEMGVLVGSGVGVELGLGVTVGVGVAVGVSVAVGVGLGAMAAATLSPKAIQSSTATIAVPITNQTLLISPSC